MKKRTVFSTHSLVDLGSHKVGPQIAGIRIMRPESSLHQDTIQAFKCNLNRIPRKALSKKVMLALLLIPIATVINMDDAFAESFTVDLVQEEQIRTIVVSTYQR